MDVEPPQDGDDTWSTAATVGTGEESPRQAAREQFLRQRTEYMVNGYNSVGAPNRPDNEDRTEWQREQDSNMIHSPEYYLGRFGVTVAGIINDHQPITCGHRADPSRIGHDVNIPDDRQLDNEAEANFRTEIEQAYPNSGLISLVSCLPYDRQWTVQELSLIHI